MDKYLFGKNISEENAEVIEMENENGTRVVGNGKLLGVLENNTLKQYNVNAKMESELNVEINNPISDYKDRYLVIGQKGGNKAYLIKDSKILWEKELEGNISQVSVNKNGYTSITLTGAYRTMVDVYDAGGNKLTRIYLANTIAVDTSISSDNKYLAFAEISTSSTSTKSNIKILSIDKAKQEELAKQVLNIDFHKIVELYDNTKKEIEIKDKEIKPIEYLDKEKMSKEEKEKFDNLGIDVIKKGQYAVVTMAGGQGTRLGHTGPKGTFKLDVYGKGKYLFEILAENLKEANKTYMVTIPWYIMTSRENNKMTRDFLEKNNYFGYDKNAVTIFIQGELPLVDVNGKFLISKEMKIKEASDGNGGTYASLRSSGALANMKERGIKWVFIGSVDNALLKMVDTTLLGMAIDKGYEIASKSVVKANPKERVGVFCKMNNHPKVIEYTELPEKMAEEIDQNGELKYGESHIMCNLFTIDAIEKISKEPLMYHSAFKKNSYIDENGKEVIPEEPNSYKFESFIFDAFEFFDDIAIMRGKREDDFAPVKNKEGADSPKTAKELYEKYWEKHGKK